MEELSEFLKAHEANDLPEAADALADLIYVATGAAHHMGLPLPDVLSIVHRCNMLKEPGRTKRGVSWDAVKPEGWIKPELQIAQLLELHSGSGYLPLRWRSSP